MAAEESTGREKLGAMEGLLFVTQKKIGEEAGILLWTDEALERVCETSEGGFCTRLEETARRRWIFF